MIRCGNCKGQHETVAEVRACCSQPAGRQDGGAPNLTEAYNRDMARRQAVASTRPRSGGGGMIQAGPNGILAQLKRSAQPATLEDSRNAALQREVFRQYQDSPTDFSPAPREGNGYSGGNKHGAPVSFTTIRTGFPLVEPGHYAIERDGVLKFYKVNHGKPGTRWAGYTFLDAQASDDYSPIKNRELKQEILLAIVANPQEAMTRYGQEIGRCGRCHRTLTDAESRAFGIGPDCRGKLGW